MKQPLHLLPTLEFVYKDSRAVNMVATAANVIRQLPAYARSLRQLDQLVRSAQPDVILNFFEPLTGFYALTRRRRPPVVAIAHQFMFQHPDYTHPPRLWAQQLSLKLYVTLVGARSTKLALSFYEAPDLPKKNIFVGPPILRRQLFQLTPNSNGLFTLVYLLNHGYADQIIKWSAANPQTKLHCFYDKPAAPPEFAHSPSLTFHRLDGEKFLRMMADCKHLVCTAGFESVSEAAWLGKPLFLVPVENHVEQEVNAVDAARSGFGIAEKTFNLDRLAELPNTLPTGAIHGWIERAEKILFDTIAHARRRAPLLLLATALLFFTGCETVAQSELVWESWDDEQPQKIWPTDPFGTLHLVDGMPVYDLGQLPPYKYSVLGFACVRAVASPGQPSLTDELAVVKLAREHAGQAVLLSRRPPPPLHSQLQQTDYLVVKFEKDATRAALELIDAYLAWSAANTDGFISPGGQVKYSAAEMAQQRQELMAQRQSLLHPRATPPAR